MAEFFVRLPEAARQLGLKEFVIEICVKDRRRKLKAAAKEQQRRIEFDRKAEKGEKAQKKEAAVKKGVQPDIGSDVEISGRMIQDMLKGGELYVHSEGSFYHWDGRVWEALLDAEVQREFMLPYDGAWFGETSRIRLNKGRVDSISKFVKDTMGLPTFFDDRPVGINVQNGFLQFAEDGSFALVPHDEGQRCRHVLGGELHRDLESCPRRRGCGGFLRSCCGTTPKES